MGSVGDVDVQVEHLDVLILGGGLSGINTARRVQQELPDSSFAILERSGQIGGTWSFWKYPGFRCDASMNTFGFHWHPWPEDYKIMEGASIVRYMEDAVKSKGIDRHIRFHHRVASANWDPVESRWVVDVDIIDADDHTETAKPVRKVFKTGFLFMCTGYYSYEKALATEIPGLANFEGTVAHPQWWPKDLDHAGKRVVIIGSGATAVTLFPTMSQTASHITMLQRSPSYVLSIPNKNNTTIFFRRFLPLWLAHWIAAAQDLVTETLFVAFLLTFPNAGRKFLTSETRKQLPPDYPVDVHFNPKYDPFLQRLCLAPNGDFFKTIRKPNAEVVTDHVDEVLKDGIRTRSGRFLPADIIVTATGLHVELFGNVQVTVDHKPVDLGNLYCWRGCMIESVPNATAIFGYIAGSWTPGADTMARLAIKLIKNARRKGATSFAPALSDAEKKGAPRNLIVHNNSSYMASAANRLPLSMGRGPWYGRVNIVKDLFALWFGSLEDGLRYDVPTLKAKDA